MAGGAQRSSMSQASRSREGTWTWLLVLHGWPGSGTRSSGHSA